MFERALKFCLQWEGGYVNHPDDPGGETNFGITQATYDRWRGTNRRSVAHITQAEVKEIYRELYWKPAKCDRCTPRLAVVMFDTAVNFGVGGAIQFLQDALGIKADGDWGSQTERAFVKANHDAIAVLICNDRYKFRMARVYENPSQRVFLEGWQNRDRALRDFINTLGSNSMFQTIRATAKTFLKGRPLQSSVLGDEDLIEIAEGATIECRPLRQEQGHTLVELRVARSGLARGGVGRFNWWIFPAHWQRLNAQTTIDWKNPTAKVSKYFTVAEVTQNDPRRVTTDPTIVRNILALAQELDKVRSAWGRPIGVTSWYRPPLVNREVGGVSNSQHLNGGAADIYPIGGDIFEFEKWLDPIWGDRALGYGADRGFVHLDLRRGGLRWDY